MIRKNTINCKLISLKSSKISGFEVFSETISSIRLADEVCPTCGLKGGCSPLGSYERYLIDFEDSAPKCRQLKVPRLICCCGASHAILPDPIIPYKQYSLFYILLVLAVHYCNILSVTRICDTYMITERTLSRWIALYREHRKEWQGLLDGTRSDIRSSILELVRKDPYSSFAIFFIKTTNRSLFQTHVNPANCQRNLQFSFFSDV